MSKAILLDSFDQLPELGIRWDDLVRSSRADHIFLTLEWLATWWKYYGTNRELFLAVVKDNRKVLAIAPLMNTTYKLFGVKLRKMEFVGTPSADYHGFILTRRSPMCVKAVLDCLNDYSATWDCVELKGIPENAETASALRTIPDDLLRFKERVLDICPFVPLFDTFEEQFRRLGRTTRKRLRQWGRQLRKDHRVEFKIYDDIGSVKEMMQTFFRLHQLRWQSRGYPGLFANQTSRDFQLEVAKRFAEKGWLRLCFLIADDEAISAVHAFEYGQKLYCYMTGFDPRYAEYGVGHLAYLHLTKYCIEKGLKELDLLRGEYPHKNRWKPLIRRNIEFSATKFGPVPKVYDWATRSKVLPILSEMLHKHVHIGHRASLNSDQE